MERQQEAASALARNRKGMVVVVAMLMKLEIDVFNTGLCFERRVFEKLDFLVK